MAFILAFVGLLIPLLLLIGTVVFLTLVVRSQRRKAKALGYPSLGAYLRAVPVSDEEKKAAADLALQGMVVCLLGMLFAPLMLIGLVPFFFGARKVVYATMGLGLVDDANQPGA